MLKPGVAKMASKTSYVPQEKAPTKAARFMTCFVSGRESLQVD